MPTNKISLKIASSLSKKEAEAPIIYAEGSYFEGKLPKDIEFIYIIVSASAKISKAMVEIAFNICTKDEKNHALLPNPLPINFPKRAYFGTLLEAKKTMVFACLHEHIAAAFRYADSMNSLFLCASCELMGGEISYSKAVEFDKNYPHSPLQDIELLNYHPILKEEEESYKKEVNRIEKKYSSLKKYASLHKELGIIHKNENNEDYWLCREYAPDATEVYLAYDANNFGNWQSIAYNKEKNGYWSVKVPYETFYHTMFYEIHLYGKYMEGRQTRVPALANWVEQNKDDENQWCARFYKPEKPYVFKHESPKLSGKPIIYEAHVGMAKDNIDKSSETARGFGSYSYFTKHTLPLIKEAGFNTIQLMGIPEHPLYKSFGYQVASYFAPSHRFGTLDEFKELVDTAHELGISVLLDIVHSHATPNTEQGLVRYDTGDFLFSSSRQTQWGTAFFDYNKKITRRFLLSNCRYWMEEFKIDGFRFDAVGSMVFEDEGFGDDFSHVNACFYTKDNCNRRNKSGILYLQLANTLIHELNSQALSIAEEFSGAPGITSAPEKGGLGFDYRFAMGIPDMWAKYIEEGQPMWKLWHECTNHRNYDKTISYVECHDQCINGEDAMIWRIIGDAMYFHMSAFTENWAVSRGVALNKLMKLLVFLTADKGYMNFMGNEFGHPEWIDADVNPYRQWALRLDGLLHYKALDNFHKDMLELAPTDFYDYMPLSRFCDEGKRVLAFERKNLLCVYNFHEEEAARIEFKVSPGKYTEIFSSDESIYAGHANLTAKNKVEHFTKAESGVFEQDIELYLPPLTGLVLVRE